MLGLLCSTVEVFVCLFALPVWFACGKLTLNYLNKKNNQNKSFKFIMMTSRNSRNRVT